VTQALLIAFREAFQCTAVLLLVRAYLLSTGRKNFFGPLLSGTLLALIMGFALGLVPQLAERLPSYETWSFFRQLTETGIFYMGFALVVLKPRQPAGPLAVAGFFLLGFSVFFFEARSLGFILLDTGLMDENLPEIFFSALGGLALGFLPLMLIRRWFDGLRIPQALTAATLLIAIGALKFAFGGLGEFEDAGIVIAVNRGILAFLENAQVYVQTGLLIDSHPFMAAPFAGLTDFLFGERSAMAITVIFLTAPPLAALLDILGRPDPVLDNTGVSAERRPGGDTPVILLRLIALLSSWRLTTALLLGLVSLYVYFTFGERPFVEWLAFVYKTPAGLLLYGFLAFNVLCASIRAAFVKLRSENIAPDTIKGMDAWVELPLAGSDTLGSVAWTAEKAGYKMDIIGASASSSKGRYSFLPGTVLRAGIVILMIAYIFSINLRKTDRAVFYEGGERELIGKLFSLGEITPNLPEDFLQVGEKSSLKLDDVSASVSESDKTYTVTPGVPVKVSDVYLRITHMGYMQPISGRTPTTVFDWDAFLDVLPPGKTDSETLLSNIHSLAFNLAPVKTVEQGLVTGKLYDLKKPLYSLAIIDTVTGEHSKSVEVCPTESARVGDVDITLGDNSVYIQLQAVQDPALSWLYSGMYLLVAGAALMLSRFFWYEKRLHAFRTYEAVLVGYSEEFYKKRGILKFQKLREELLAQARSRE
jgi:hypothetical protein